MEHGEVGVTIEPNKEIGLDTVQKIFLKEMSRLAPLK